MKKLVAVVPIRKVHKELKTKNLENSVVKIINS